MRRNLLSAICALLVTVSGFAQDQKQPVNPKKNAKEKTLASNGKLTKKQVKELRKKHAYFLANNPVKANFGISRSDRKAAGLPPNQYMEQQFLLSMNPSLGRPTAENLESIREQLQREREIALANRIPGDASDNLWVERGPNNVGGRTRAIIFDPTDATGKRVIAGGVSGGLWKNNDITTAGTAWTRITTLPEHLNVQTITIDPNSTSTWYVGTGESYVFGDVNGNGVWKTTDAGTTWTRVFGGGTVSTTPSAVYNLEIIAPSAAGVIRGYATGRAGFGPALTTMTAPIVLVNDGTAPDVTDACEAVVGSLAGKIVLIRRGTCSFESKVVKAQNAGAIGVIIMNNVAGAGAVGMADDAAETATIPSVMISKEDGDLLEANLTNLTGTLKPTPTGEFTGNIIGGVQVINDVAIKNNGGNSDIYVALGDGLYSNSRNNTLFSPKTYGVYKSTNGGSTWTKLTLPLAPSGNETSPNDIEIGADGKIWVSSLDSWTYGDGGGKVFASADNGATFTTKHTVTGNGGGSRVEIETSATNANKIYVLSELSQATATATIEVKIELTTNGFATTPTELTLPNDTDSRSATYGFTGAQAFYDLMIEADPNNDANVYVGGLNIHKSTNSGTSWTQITDWTTGNLVHSDQHAMTFKPGATTTGAVFGNDGGIYYCANLAGATNSSSAITAMNNGFNVTQFVGVAVMPGGVAGVTGDFFVAGAQDNGSQYYAASATTTTGATAGINSTFRIQSGDGGKPLFAQDSDKYYVTNYVYNDNMNFRTIGTTTTRALSSIVAAEKNMGLFYPAMALDSNLDMVYSDFTGGSPTTYQIRRYSNIKSGAVSRTNLTNTLLNSYPTALTVSKYTTASTTLFAGLMNGRLLKITGANGASAVYTNIAGASFIGSISDVKLGASENQIFVTMYNYGVNNIWYTNNGTSATPTWYRLDGDLPDLPVNCILQNPLNTAEIMIGTDLGVWYANTFNPTGTADQSLSWRQAYNGMSGVRVTDLDLQPNSPTAPTAYNVYASTYGRGVFSGPLTSALLSVNQNDLIAKSISVYPTINNGTVTITADKSYGKTNLELFDITGKVVNTTTIDLNNDKNKINFGSLNSGNYILKISGDGFTTTKRLVIE